MKKINQIFLIILTLSISLVACKKSTSENSEAELKAFLISQEGTYGWVTESDNIALDFFADGRLVIQGPEGESTMWEGSWKLSGSQLTMQRVDQEPSKEETVTAKVDGENLILGDKTYSRYAP